MLERKPWNMLFSMDPWNNDWVILQVIYLAKGCCGQAVCSVVLLCGNLNYPLDGDCETGSIGQCGWVSGE